MTSTSDSRYSRLQPLPAHERASLAIQAFAFFSPTKYEENLRILGENPDPSKTTRPLSVIQFIEYLEKTEVLNEAFKSLSQITALLEAMEREGLLVVVGHGNFVLAPKLYYSMKELTSRERKGYAWLTPALGADFLYGYFGKFTVHIIGDNNAAEHGGTGFVISDRHILTCAHVINGMTVRTEQTFQGKACRVKQTYVHPLVDVGIIELEEPCLNDSKAIGFRDPVIGEQLYLLGYPPVPMASEAPLILQGGEVVNERILDYQQQEAFLYSAIARPGNSGGPIIARSGHVLGIVTEDRNNPDHPHALFFAGLATSTIANALAELSAGVDLPVETYQ
ncbi:serine protease [Pseudomonas kielensis]|uniref:S1 family peptidase n=1 Tax=Pseudomonas kielensis TaxID=2762577 RepID=UPI00265F9F8D|nr:serine protease [Pseudomonas kielensis]WKL52862.1 serine protease [Pseudomonas kielensis]